MTPAAPLSPPAGAGSGPAQPPPGTAQGRPPAARLVLPGTATEAEWLAARRQGITASEIAIVMGLSPWSSPFALYHRKRGDLPEQPDNAAMRLGRYLEEYTCNIAAERLDQFVTCGNGRELYAHPDRLWQLATPDRLLTEGPPGYGMTESDDGVFSFEPVAVLEAKTTASYDGWGEDGTDEIPVHYRCQVLWQMDVLGVTTGYVACLFLHSRTLRVYELTMDTFAGCDLAIMREHAKLFLARLENHDPPDVDWRPATTGALKALHPLVKDEDAVIPEGMARAYHAAAGRYRTAEQRKKLAENRIRDRIGPARRAVLKDGTPVATRSVYEQNRIDSQLLRSRHPGVAAECTKKSTTDKLLPAKKETP